MKGNKAVVKFEEQVVTPAGLRKRHRRNEGTTVVFQEEKRRLALELCDWAGILALRGSVPFDLEGSLIEQRALEAKREEERAEEYERGVAP